jgi:hypothetical protein
MIHPKFDHSKLGAFEVLGITPERGKELEALSEASRSLLQKARPDGFTPWEMVEVFSMHAQNEAELILLSYVAAAYCAACERVFNPIEP